MLYLLRILYMEAQDYHLLLVGNVNFDSQVKRWFDFSTVQLIFFPLLLLKSSLLAVYFKACQYSTVIRISPSSILWFFFSHPCGLQGLSSPARDWTGPWQWNQWVLTTGPPGSSLIVLLTLTSFYIFQDFRSLFHFPIFLTLFHSGYISSSIQILSSSVSNLILTIYLAFIFNDFISHF